MDRDEALPVIQDESAGKRGLNRRQMVRRLLAGAGAVWPMLTASSHPIRALLADETLLAEADARMAAADWQPTFLNTHQNELLIALSESIVPGSGKAQVNRFIDLLLRVDGRAQREKFVASLSAFDSESQRSFGHSFAALTENQKNELLTIASRKDEAESGNSSHEKHSEDSTLSLYDHFENLKGWVSGTYYSSEAGMRELGWTGDYVFESYPACDHAEGHG